MNIILSLFYLNFYSLLLFHVFICYPFNHHFYSIAFHFSIFLSYFISYFLFLFTERRLQREQRAAPPARGRGGWEKEEEEEEEVEGEEEKEREEEEEEKDGGFGRAAGLRLFRTSRKSKILINKYK